jgi:hypothetical protein
VFFKAPPCPSDIPPHWGRALLQENEVKVWDLVKVKIEELDKYVLRWSLVL